MRFINAHVHLQKLHQLQGCVRCTNPCVGAHMKYACNTCLQHDSVCGAYGTRESITPPGLRDCERANHWTLPAGRLALYDIHEPSSLALGPKFTHVFATSRDTDGYTSIQKYGFLLPRTTRNHCTKTPNLGQGAVGQFTTVRCGVV